MREPIATWNPARGVWETDQKSLFCEHSELFSATWPTSGSMRSGRVFAPATSGHPTNESASSSSLGIAPSLPTPRARDWKDTGNFTPHPEKVRLTHTIADLMPTPTATPYGSNQSASDGAAVRPSLETLVPLLPTPDAYQSDRGGRSQVLSDAPEGTASASPTLLPTPKTTDSTGPGRHGTGGADLKTVIWTLFDDDGAVTPTP